MTLNPDFTTSTNATAPTPQLLRSNPLLMSQESSSPVSEWSEPEEKTRRNLAWNVAPNLLVSFKYAWAGLRYAFITQRNFRIHTIIGTIAITLGMTLRVSGVEMAIVGLTISLVLTFELLNTALESVVDLTVKQSYHELAKIAKDCAAGAVLVSAIAAIFVGCLILLPPLYATTNSLFNHL
ncbi:diacylglycerol kinase family protein [Lusitaniella coriacea LEGE 07157]|uniref:Diacylglycerol kinase family protein n=1 Tax=Lusitaniella coriacea LEGE 07157 TaxID=945747 RepID=A0A8J7JD20_9CYAN|nr:diacylglycerol kinase family protein [Lusitaniella coriacea]MBE9118060.1 diacylglycerol kinase family protein [Lusitaniella coriacea LEGE 07157]